MGIELKPSRKGSQSLWVSCLLANTQVQDPAGVTGGGDTTLGLHPKSGRFSAKRCSCFRRCLRFIFLLESDLTSMYGLSSDFLKKTGTIHGKNSMGFLYSHWGPNQCSQSWWGHNLPLHKKDAHTGSGNSHPALLWLYRSPWEITGAGCLAQTGMLLL